MGQSAFLGKCYKSLTFYANQEKNVYLVGFMKVGTYKPTL